MIMAALLAAAALNAGRAPMSGVVAACGSLDALAGISADAAPAMGACLERVGVGGLLVLKPGVYTLRSRVTVGKSVTIMTAGLRPTARACNATDDLRCATLLLVGQRDDLPQNAMPIEVKASDVTLSHLIIRGSKGRDPAYDRRVCDDPKTRPLGGGIRVVGGNFTLARSVVRDMACYTAVEVVASADGPKIHDNIIGPNGDHGPGGRWADGVTIHDTSHAFVARNLFVNNTDVQLIFGGCRSCRIIGNRFRHTGAFSGASFAALMLHAWPRTTSGRYDDTVVSGNDINCGPDRRCGYGIMIGAHPWYNAPTSGGAVIGNTVANAMVGLNIDGLSGSMTIRSNKVALSGGWFSSDCGSRRWPAVNVAPSSRKFVKEAPSPAIHASIDTSGCILNRNPRR